MPDNTPTGPQLPALTVSLDQKDIMSEMSQRDGEIIGLALQLRETVKQLAEREAQLLESLTIIEQLRTRIREAKPHVPKSKAGG